MLADRRFAELDAERSSNVTYYALSLIFKGETIAPDDVLVDVGCGKGRVLNWWLSKRLPNRIVGLELDPEVAAHTRHRLRKYRNVTIITGDFDLMTFLHGVTVLVDAHVHRGFSSAITDGF